VSAVADERPINADVPAPEPPAQPRRRRPVPGALKAIAALVVLAIAFIVAAIVGGTGSGEKSVNSPVIVKENGDLDYPALATSNTTRVGGADPASNAAAVALATYPSTSEEQRPAAVALVGEDEWQTAIAAAVLMADPVGAPILFSNSDGLPEPSDEALDALQPRRTIRVRAGAPATSAAAIARLRERLAGKPPEHIVVAPVQSPGFAMPAAAWAARSGDPVLFADLDSLPKPTAAALKRHPDVPVYVLGPSSAISSDVVREIAKIDDRVRRVSGEDPVANAIALARYADGGFGWNVNDPGHGFVVARADSPLDAAAAAPLSASGTWGPLLLTDSADTLPGALRGYLLDVKPGYTTDPTRAFYNHVWVIGDQETIDVNQQAEIDNLAELAKIGGAP
jgi:hypothetical protein